MDSLKRNVSANWSQKHSCSQAGVNKDNQWDVRGFYDEKFNDPWNFNLNENAVSLISASAISFSLILFIDIVFRVLVRAKVGRASREVVSRRRVLETFSNPINLLSMAMRRISTISSAPSEGSQVQEQGRYPGLSKRTYGTLILMGGLTVFSEFMFIFLATNQNKVYHVQLDSVPIFEFDDRGCEFINAPAAVNACGQSPLSPKAGFDSRGSIQICTTNVVYSSSEATRFNESYHYFLLVSVLNGDNVQVIVMDRETTSLQSTRIGVLLDQNGRFYVGRQSVTSEHLLSALSKRMERTNTSLIANSTLGNGPRPDKNIDSFQQLLLTNVGLMRQRKTAVGASVFVDANNVDLRETHLSRALTGNDSKDDIQQLMHTYFLDVMRSLMFPTGKERGMVSLNNGIQYLDQDPSPLAYYNRPWIGVLPSLFICCILLLIWIVLAGLGIESDVDARLAWQKFFKDADTSRVDDVENGISQSEDMH